MNRKKSVDEHCEFVFKAARLSFFYAWNIRDFFPSDSLDHILMLHTPLYYDILGLPVGTIHDKLQTCSAENAGEFEDRMFVRTKEFLLDRAVELYPFSIGIFMPPDYQCGSLKYDPPNRELPKGWGIFHIRNAIAPESIFTDPQYLPDCFEKLMDASEKQFGYTELFTRTWLNDYPKFLALFPEEWKNSLSERDESAIPGWDLGSWGQIVNARGTFNDKMGEYIRTNMRLRYISRASHCSFAAMRRHLKETGNQR